MSEKGFALVAALLVLSVIMTMMSAYMITGRIELATTRYSKDSIKGFYAAEAGLNLRAEEVRATFVGFNRPSGTSPLPTDACEVGNLGSGDFSCQNISLANHNVDSYVVEEPGNPIILTIPPGELYQNLNAQEYRYTVNSVAHGIDDRVEAILELRFKSRLVPLFQFAAFYDKDLEILPGPAMTLAGPVHTNGDLYLDAGDSLDILGQVTTAGDMFRGRKNNNSCQANPTRVADPLNQSSLLPSCSTRTQITETDIEPWNGMIQMGVDSLTVPGPEVFDPVPGAIYWDRADLRLVLALDGSNNLDTGNSVTGVEVRTPGNTFDPGQTNQLNTCAGSIGESAPGVNDGTAVGFSNTFFNNRENITIQMLDVDMLALLNCLDSTNWLGEGKALSDDTEGGLVFHFTVSGPNSLDAQSGYGVRISNANRLQSTNGGAPLVQGLSIISDQASYTWGDFNGSPGDWIPSAIMSDAFNVLSSAWDDGNSGTWSSRIPVDTTIRAAILAGTDTTGGVEGAGGQGGDYNGGLENYPRMHEQWSSSPKKTLTYRGSFVSLGNSRRSTGAWKYGSPQYSAPVRDWTYDVQFNDAANLPPITPRFVYLRQELFVRDYEQ